MPRAFLVFKRWGSSLRGFPQLPRSFPNPQIEEKYENSTVDGHSRRRRFLRRLQQEGRDDAPRRPPTPAPATTAPAADRRCRLGRDVVDDGCLVGCGCRFVGRPPLRRWPRAPPRSNSRSRENAERPPLGRPFALPMRLAPGRAQPSRSQPKPAHRVGDDDRRRRRLAPATASARRAPAPGGCSRGSGARRRRAAGGRWRSAPRISAAVALLRWPKRPPMRALSERADSATLASIARVVIALEDDRVAAGDAVDHVLGDRAEVGEHDQAHCAVARSAVAAARRRRGRP